MTITIHGAKKPPKWTELQAAIITMLGVEGRFTRIARADGQCNYTLNGAYRVTFTSITNEDTDILLHVAS